MGGGGGVIIEKIGLAQYQASRGGELTVEVNDGVNTYTWVADGEYTVSANVEIIFEETDRMVIPEDTSVTLEGIFNISETTDNFTRIQNDGTLTIAEGAEIEFGTINGSQGGGAEDDGVGIQNDGTLTIAEGAEIEFGTIVGTPGGEVTPSGIGIRTTSSESTYVSGKITFNKLEEASTGLDVQKAGDDGGKVTLESTGRLIFKTIECTQVDSSTDGIFIDDNGIFEQSGSIEVESIIGIARLMQVGRETTGTCSYTQESKGTITIKNIIGLNAENGSVGIFINSGGTFTQKGSVRIINAQKNSNGIIVGKGKAPFPDVDCSYIQNADAVITIDQLAGGDAESDDPNNSFGIFIKGKGSFTQNGNITFKDIRANCVGIRVGRIEAELTEAATYYTGATGNITIEKIAGSNDYEDNISNGISAQGNGTFTQDGNITFEEIQQNVSGIIVGTKTAANDAAYNQDSGTITIKKIAGSSTNGDLGSSGIITSGKGTFTQKGNITLEDIQQNVSGILVGAKTATQNAAYNQDSGTITINTIAGSSTLVSFGIDTQGLGTFTQKGNITFEDIQQNVSGIVVGARTDPTENAIYNQESGTITINQIAGTENLGSYGINIRGLGTFTQKDEITINNIEGNGIVVGKSSLGADKDAAYIQDSGAPLNINTITGFNDTNYSTGIFVDKEGTLTQNEDITITNGNKYVNMISIRSGGKYQQPGGNLEISNVQTPESVTNRSFGILIADNDSLYNQTDGTIQISEIGFTNNETGILVDNNGQLNVKNLAIIGEDISKGTGLQSNVVQGVNNSGIVGVNRFAVNYTDGVFNVPPASVNNLKANSNNFTGDGTYSTPS